MEGRTPAELAVLSDLAPEGLLVQVARQAARLRGQTGRLELSMRNLRGRVVEDLALVVQSAACTVRVTPIRVPRLEPGQRVDFQLDLARRSGVDGGTHRIDVVVSAWRETLGRFELEVDANRAETPVDRGMIRLGKGSLRPASHALGRYSIFLAVSRN